MAFFGVEFGTEAGEGAGGVGDFVGGAGDAFACAFLVVEAVKVSGRSFLGGCGRWRGSPLPVLFSPFFDVFVLRL